MEDLKEKFEKYLTDIHVTGLNSTDKLTRSRYFNGKVEDFYTKQMGLNPAISRTELVVALSSVRVKYQVVFVEILD